MSSLYEWCAVPLLAIGACGTLGQTPPASQPVPNPAPPASATSPDATMQVPTLSSNANEVTLDLVVKDKKHKPVLDLKPEDFVVTDNDVPVKLTGLSFFERKCTLNQATLLRSSSIISPVPPPKSHKLIALKIIKMLPSKGYSYSVFDIPGRLRLIQGFTDNKTAADAVKIITEKAAADRTQTIELTYTGGIVQQG